MEASSPTCGLRIADNPHIQDFFVEADNGWTAELERVEGDPSLATGGGAGSTEVGGVSAGAAIDVDLSALGASSP